MSPFLRSRFLQLLKSWLPVTVWMLVMFSASTDVLSAPHTSRFLEPFLRWLIPSLLPASFEELHWIFRKGGHVTEYAILAVFLRHAIGASYRNPTARSFWRICISAFVLATIFAVSDEFHQTFVPSRGASVLDVLLDACGALLGLAMLIALEALAKGLPWQRPTTAQASAANGVD